MLNNQLPEMKKEYAANMIGKVIGVMLSCEGTPIYHLSNAFREEAWVTADNISELPTPKENA